MLTMERWMTLSFAEVVKRRRKELGLTQERLAEKAGRDYSHVSRVEQGYTFRRLPDVEEFRHWAETLELPPEVILTQMGYIDEPDKEKGRKPEVIFTSLAEEIRSAEEMPADVRQTMLDGLGQARRLYDALKKSQ